MVAKPPSTGHFPPQLGAVYLRHVKMNRRILEEGGAGRVRKNGESEPRRSAGDILI